MPRLPYDVINKIYEFIDVKEEHKNAFRLTLFKIGDVRTWETFRAYFVHKYKTTENFWSIKIQIFEEPENRWRYATVNSACLFGGFYADGGPAHSNLHVLPMKDWKAFDWDNFNGWWRPIHIDIYYLYMIHILRQCSTLILIN